jgi:hypothetical protein
MRENRPYGSEGGEGQTLPDPYHQKSIKSTVSMLDSGCRSPRECPQCVTAD